jgi:hypothetical protein
VQVSAVKLNPLPVNRPALGRAAVPLEKSWSAQAEDCALI